MGKSVDYLRKLFEAGTDIVIGSKNCNWREYSLWLEKLKIKEINHDLIKENEHLKDKIESAIDILHEGLADRY